MRQITYPLRILGFRLISKSKKCDFNLNYGHLMNKLQLVVSYGPFPSTFILKNSANYLIFASILDLIFNSRSSNLPSMHQFYYSASPIFANLTIVSSFSETTSIFRGRDVSPQRYPYFATLKVAKTGKVFCGGALISQSYIITTASCVMIKGKGIKKAVKNIEVKTEMHFFAIPLPLELLPVSGPCEQ